VQGVSYVFSELLGPELQTAAFLDRMQLLLQQLQRWAAKTPRDKPSFAEMVSNGSFVPLDQILAKTLPHIAAAVEAFKPDSISSAKAVRDACILAAVAGDGNANQRPGELQWIRDGRIQGTCMDPKAGARRPRRAAPRRRLDVP